MTRHHYAPLAVAAAVALLAVAGSVGVGIPLHDPDGFVGPSYLRLPLLLAAGFLADVVPRSLWALVSRS